jgi:hypothetical protein
MKTPVKWLQGQDACEAGIEWFVAQKETDGLKIVKKLIKENQLLWANWLIVRIMSHKQRIAYAIYAAELVLAAYEKQYPDNPAPRNAIMAAKAVLKNNTATNRSAWSAARSAARSAAESAESAAGSAAGSAARSAAESARSAAWSAAWSAASAARSAAESAAGSAARSAAESARSAAESARSAAWSAAWSAASAAESAAQIKILKYGIKILESKK